MSHQQPSGSQGALPPGYEAFFASQGSYNPAAGAYPAAHCGSQIPLALFVPGAGLTPN